MKKPVLVVMAAGMGSRYGGLKQIDPISENGNIIMDYSIFDAYKAGFRDVLFIIKKDLHDIFRDTVGKRAEKYMNVSYVFQELENYTNNNFDDNRIKPFGTGHAVLCTKETLNSPFVVINADDFYGQTAFKLAYDFLKNATNDDEYALISYNIENTLTENGYVSRGVCKADDDGNLCEIIERTQIEIKNGQPHFTEDGENYTLINAGTPVSMNMWAFTPKFLNHLESMFFDFMANDLPKNPLKAEFYLPFAVDMLINAKKVCVKVLKTDDKWYGVTYKEDKPMIVNAIANMKDKYNDM